MNHFQRKKGRKGTILTKKYELTYSFLGHFSNNELVKLLLEKENDVLLITGLSTLVTI